MPKLIKLYITNAAIGFVLSAVFVGLLLGLNIAGLRDLITSDSMGWLAILMLWVLNGIVFAGVQFAIAVMRLGNDAPPSGGNAYPLEYAPIRVTAPKKKRQF